MARTVWTRILTFVSWRDYRRARRYRATASQTSPSRKMDCPDPEGRPVEILKTSDFYRTCQLPKRFEYPSWFYGYGIQRRPPDHPFYRTTSSDYGRYPPTIHSVPTSFFPTDQEFSKALAKTGMYRNYSLNTGLDHQR